MPNKKRLIDMIAVYFAVFAASLAVSFFLSPKTGLSSEIIIEIVIFAIPFLAIKIRGEKVTERFNLRAVPARDLLGSILLTAGAGFAASAILSVLSVFFKGASEVDSGLNSLINDNPGFLIVTALIVLPAVCEELLFRGYIQSAFNGARPWIMICGVGILFGVMHFDVYKMLPCAVIGGVFAYITYVTGSVLPTVICHLINNAYSVVTRYMSSVQGGGDVYEIVFKNTSRIFVALAMLAAAFIIGYIGNKILTGRKLKKPFGVIFVLVSLVVVSVSFSMVTRSEFKIDIISESSDKLLEKTFTVDSDRVIAITVSAQEKSGQAVYISIDGENGEVIASGASSAGIMSCLEKGDYKITVTSDSDDAEITADIMITAGPEVKKVQTEMTRTEDKQ